MTALGKRYTCEACNAELLCTKPGDGMPACCDQEMVVKGAKPLPSSD